MSARAAASDVADLVAAAQPGAVEPRRIGPNALTQVADALVASGGRARAEAVFEAAGLWRRLAAPPTAMVPAAEAAALNRALFETLPREEAEAVLARAGARLGDYLLAHRIPRLAQRLIRAAPSRLGRALLYGAIRRNAETFAGADRFSAAISAQSDILTIEESAPAADMRGADGPVCGLFAGTFERLLRVLVSDRLRVREIECAAMGAPACRFAVRRRDAGV